MRLSLSSALAALCLATPCPAAADDTQLWTGLTVKGKAPGNDRLSWSANTELRFTDNISDHSTSVLRASADYRLENGTRIGGGAARFYNGGLFSDRREDRLWQQASHALANWKGGALTGRTRLEQRMRAQGGETGWRVRQRASYERDIPNSDFSWTLWGEAFYALNGTQWGQDPGLDQTRLGVTLNWKATDRVSIDTGYMHIGIDGENGIFSESRHTFTMTMSLSL